MRHPVGTVLLAVLFVMGFFGARQLLLDLSEEWYQGTDAAVVACPADAMLCPDGSAVGRTGSQCEFAPCPSLPEPEVETQPEPEPVPELPPILPSMSCDTTNRPEVCTREYQPVCGLVEIQCITTPCNPIPETFSNACTACSQSNVSTYTAGACEAG